MTTRNFDALFAPGAIALIGASNKPGSVGHVSARNLIAGGFSGELSFVNPHETAILGRRCVEHVSKLTRAPDLAVIATPAGSVAGIAHDLGQRGCRAAIVISAGDETFRADLLKAAQPYSMRILGPNCLGFLSPVAGINASFAQLTPKRGKLALVSQSGAIATAMLDWAHGRAIGFSHLLSLGDMIDADFGDAIDYLALDPNTDAILLYVEQITHARKFLSAARIAARAKPVIVIKAGRSAGGAKAAQSHTGALAGADAVYDAAFRRAGMLRVDTLRELFDAAETLASDMRPAGDRLMILTNGGGLGVLAVDALEQQGGQLATLSAQIRARLDAALPHSWSHNNPIDIIGDADGARYAAALDALAEDSASDALLVMNCPTGVADNADCARAVVEHGVGAKPLLACWMGAASLEAPRAAFQAAGIPCFEAPEDAVKAFVQLQEFAQNQRALLETPAPLPERAPEAFAQVAAIIAAALKEGRLLLSAAESKQALAAYGLSVAEAIIAKDPETAAKAARNIGKPVALKILSPDLSHKSDVGGVALNLAPEDVAPAARLMLERVRRAAPEARLSGFTVEAMIDKAMAHELIVGASLDPTFGPVVLFGHGGVSVEVVADTALALPPLNSLLALDLIKRTRVSQLLAGYRDQPAANLDAVSRALTAVSELVCNHAEIVEIDINPLLADQHGAIALDARVVVRANQDTPTQRMAIMPYPAELACALALAGGQRFQLRPIRPQDAPSLLTLGGQTSVRDMTVRFRGAVQITDALGAARLSQLDYDREMALAAFELDGAMAGVARVHFDPQIASGEFSILVRTDLQRLGLGQALMEALIAYARERGAEAMSGEILAENTGMLALAQRLGAEISPALDGRALRATIKLERR